MRYGRGHDGSYFEQPDDDVPGYVHHVSTVEHDPRLAHFHDAIHVGAVDLIRAYHHRSGFEYLVLHSRRILEHDAHNATTELRDRYTADLVAALRWIAGDTSDSSARNGC